jgi:hypothetical protein
VITFSYNVNEAEEAIKAWDMDTKQCNVNIKLKQCTITYSLMLVNKPISDGKLPLSSFACKANDSD